jgi:hypothetical protein
MSVANLLFGLSIRLRFKNRTQARRRARPSNRRSTVAAEVSLLEPRCLLSSGGAKGAHAGHAAPLDDNGNPVYRNFAGFIWNANYRWSQDSGSYQDGQLWSSNNAQVTANGLQLTLTPTILDGKPTTISADVELVQKADGEPFHPGYGKYLVSAETPGTFAQLKNSNGPIFGAFTYENLMGVGQFNGNRITGLPQSLINHLHPGFQVTSVNYLGQPLVPTKVNGVGENTKIERIEGNTVVMNKSSINNPGNYPHTVYFLDNRLKNGHRELDMVENVYNTLDPNDKTTNAQFTLQPYQELNGNVHRFTSNDNGQMTLVMDWKGANEPVKFEEFNGTYNFSDLPATPNVKWTTGNGQNGTPNQNPFIPDNGQQTFHLNLWWAWWTGTTPTTPQTVTVTNFEYKHQA